jgi:two-component system response regulator BaeR
VIAGASGTVLVVEDEPKLAALVVDYLAVAGFAASTIADGDAVVAAVRERTPDLVLLDVMLPGKDGMAICREIRAFSDVPIVMMTARVEEIDRLLGLEIGADDYVCKPFSTRELVARVKAILRRVRRPAAVARVTVDDERHEATLDGRVLPLTPVEFRLLRMLADKPGRVLSRERVLAGLYDDRRIVTDRTVDSHVKNLRRKLKDAGGDDILRSIYGVGYKLEI